MTTRTDAYGTRIETTERLPGMLTPPEAAKSIGISTIKFNKMRRLAGISGTIVTGTEKNKYPVIVLAPEQIAEVAKAL